jgi:quercetin dioxygenase-like cupin family protein
MKVHNTKFSITIITLRGSIAFGAGERTFILNERDIITHKGNVMHELKALEESIVRLSLNKSDPIPLRKE